MKWLIWKEYRLQRLILVVGVFLLVVPYTVPFYQLMWNSRYGWTLGFAACSSTILSILTLALLGGNAIACERADRSAEFQAYQPIPRWAVLLSKLALPILAALVLWSVNLLFYEQGSPRQSGMLPDREWMFTFMLFGFCAFSVAWLVSAMQSSPTFAVGAGMAAPVATMLQVALIYWLVDGLPSRSLEIAWTVTIFTLGLLSFAAGTWYYLRRVEP